MSDASNSERDPQCLFCRIVAREIEADFLHDDGVVIGIRDISPQAPTHAVFIPVRHLADAAALGPDDGELLAALFSAANAYARSSGIGEGGYRLVMNVGDDAGNTVPHLHLHLLAGRQLTWPPG